MSEMVSAFEMLSQSETHVALAQVCTATHCNTLQHTATHRNTLKRTWHLLRCVCLGGGVGRGQGGGLEGMLVGEL